MELQAKDLRIGNLYKSHSGKIEEVDLNLFNLLWTNNEIELDEIIKEPILLNGYWLENCGAIRSHHEHYELPFNDFSLCWDEDGLDISFRDQDIAQPLNHIKYLHQLQNLVIDLGEELTIKETVK